MAFSCVYPSGYTLTTEEQSRYPANKRFTSLATWEAQNLDLVTAQDMERCEILSGDATNNWGTAGADSRVDINGWVTSSAYNIELVALTDARHAGTWNPAKFRIEYDGWDTSFTSRVSNVKVFGFQIKKSHPSDTGVAFNLANCDNISFVDTLFWRPTTAAQGWGIAMSSQRTGLYAENCIFYGGSFRTIFTDSYNENSAAFLNCTIVDCVDRGLAVTSGPGVLTVKNCYVGNSGITDYQGAVMTTCASSDATGSAGLQSIPISTTAGTRFASITAGSEDYSITTGSALIDVGTDLSVEFTDDIAGNARGALWDIGAFELVSGGTSVRVTDSGQGSDSIVELLSSLSISDVGSGADGFTGQTALSVSDAGVGIDNPPTLSINLSVSDTGTASDIVGQILSALSITDSGTATDLISILKTKLIQIMDAGTGVDAIQTPSVSVVVSDIAAGLDLIGRVTAVLSVSDTGAGADIVTVINSGELARGAVSITFQIKMPGISFSAKKPNITF